jgi:hypothetical protein
MMEWLSVYQEIIVGIERRNTSIHPNFLYSRSQQTRLQYLVGKQDLRIMRLLRLVFLLCRRIMKDFLQKFQDVY